MLIDIPLTTLISSKDVLLLVKSHLEKTVGRGVKTIRFEIVKTFDPATTGDIKGVYVEFD